EWIPSSERGIANGIIFAGVGFGAGLASPLVTNFMVNYGWRSSFWVSAALGLLAGGIWFLIARDRPHEHPWISPVELAHIEAGLPQTDASAISVKLSWGAIFSNRQILLVTGSY